MEIKTTNQTSIAAFLHQMKFKKKIIGGVDEEDVLDKITHIINIYNDLTEDLNNQNTSLYQNNIHMKSLVDKLQTVEQAKDEKISSLQLENTFLIQERDALTTRIQEISDKMQQYEEEQVTLLDTAQREARKITMLAEARMAVLAAQKERETEQLLSMQQAEIEYLSSKRRLMKKEVDDLRIMLKSNLQLITDDLYRMLSLTKELDYNMVLDKNDYEHKSV